jgi:hypothetical protein
MSGKGSKPRPLSVSYDTYKDNWDEIFRKEKSDYQDILSTEECVENVLNEIDKEKDSSL